jgi:DNA-binding response OmpR family regulator
MVTKNNSTANVKYSETDRRERLARLNVLVADRDFRTASLVQRILFSFGFRNMDVTTNGESALALLRSRPYNILITEWNMVPVDGVALVKAIRTAKDDARIPRDIPILMLTAKSDKESVLIARDAGITEFVAKPFSAKTISNRIIQIVDNPRVFIESATYIGPDRRRRGEPPPGVEDRRGKGKSKISPANTSLQKELGSFSAAEIINDLAVAQAQAELLKAENDFIDWAREDIMQLEKAYKAIKLHPNDKDAQRDLIDAAYAIKSQAGIFGYPLGTEVAGLMVEYLSSRRKFNSDNLIVVSKHIDTISVIFKQKIKENGQGIAMDMLHSLKKLIFKLG